MTLQQLLDNGMERDEIKKLLLSFKSIPQNEDGNPNDVEFFLHEKAINLERIGASRTYLVFDEHGTLLGYYALASKPLIIAKKNLKKLSSNQRTKLRHHGQDTESGALQVYSYLLGQLGKNYNIENSIDGKDLLTLAYNSIKAASEIINAKYIWLECEDNHKLKNFYSDFGFKEVNGYTSKNNMKVMILKIEQKKNSH
ncbi:hypothetical protein [Streptococcus sp. 263_SSPC]|uniref:hypothetical protein n=1 Tax=Streptococcus sp. 263_SSPC TaxID=1579343 RepID=UPI000660901E|nr:hypothetical protein [Streptococcus sp. 263_SSPC]